MVIMTIFFQTKKKWPMRSRLYSTMMMIDTFERSKNDETIFEDTMIIDQNIQSI